MKEIRIYKVTKWKIFREMSLGLFFIIWGISGIIFALHDKSSGLFNPITIIVSSFIMGAFGIYPTYLCWIYYQLDKEVKIVVNRKNREFEYIQQGKIIRVIKFEEVVKVYDFNKLRIVPSYYLLTLKDGKKLTITSLLMSEIKIIVPHIKIKSISNDSLIPDIWETKKEQLRKDKEDAPEIILSKWMYVLIYGAILVLIIGLFWLALKK